MEQSTNEVYEYSLEVENLKAEIKALSDDRGCRNVPLFDLFGHGESSSDDNHIQDLMDQHAFPG